MLRKILAVISLVFLAASPVSAEWHKASSRHFIIYSDQRPDKLREFAERLERFDKAVRTVRGMSDPEMGDGNRLTVFVVDDVKEVRKLARATMGMAPDLGGFYRASFEGSIAVVPERSGNTLKRALDDQSTFYHEYAHHLMYYDLSRPAPLWYSEGFAEFMSTADFERDGTVILGRVATGRAYGVKDRKTFPMEAMLSGKRDDLTEEQWAALYARGWLLTHYLTFEASRKGQIEKYLGMIAKGVEPLEAATNAFGDLDVLDRNINGYINRRRLNVVKVEGAALTPGPIQVEQLTAGAAEILPYYMQLKAGIPSEERDQVYAEIRTVAAKHPTDPFAQTVLAMSEFADADYAASEAAADRAIAINPRQIDALIYKGRAMLELASDSEEGKTFDEARQWFLKANKLDTEDPEPLLYFFEAHMRENGRPTPNAIAALHYASDLAPQDLGLRMRSAFQYLQEEKLAEARSRLVPIAFNPHGGGYGKMAKQAIEAIDAGDASKALRAMRGGSN